jgi:RNA polymerase sigma-70 factor (ECF subfamily)
MDEIMLVQAAQAGNRTALRELYEQNKRKIFALAYQYAKNREDAEDILQETFIKAFRRIHTFRLQEKTSFASWLFRVGINCSIDYLRRNKARRAELGQEVLAAVPAAAPGTDPQQEHAGRELRRRIDSFLSGLSPKQRMIFLLKHDQQLSIREIAAQLQCTEGSVKTHLFRAVSAIKRGFKEPALEDPS